MENIRLLASVALFKSLYDNRQSFYDVIVEFIKAVIIFNKKWSFNSTDITEMLVNDFDFTIPEAIVRSVLKNRLKKEKYVDLNSGIYTVDSAQINSSIELINQLSDTSSKHSKIIDGLIEFIEHHEGVKLKDGERKEVLSSFRTYILDKSENIPFSAYISSFIISRQDDTEFRKTLNSIKEGLILYTGVRYTADLNQLGKWENELTVYLDTEHLFSAVGLNGSTYKQIFEDFYALATEINKSNLSSSGTKKIHLKYHEETKNDAEKFFYAAEKILEGKGSVHPSKTAMISLINGCSKPSEIVSKKNKFYSDIKGLGILEEKDKGNVYSNPKWNIEDQSTIKSIGKKVEDSGRIFQDEDCQIYLKLFTKINVDRKGRNEVYFEKVGYVLATANSFAHFLARTPEVKPSEKSIPFTCDLDFLTEKFWFKLKKGLGTANSYPKSFDIVTRAQVALSSQMKSTASNEYEAIKRKFDNGELTKEEAIELNYALRNNIKSPEEINTDNIDSSLEFLTEDIFEKFSREQSLLIQRAKRGDDAIKELKRRDLEKWKEKIRPLKRTAKILYHFLQVGLMVLILIIVTFLCFLILKFKDGDSWISIGFGIIGLMSVIIPLIKKKKVRNQIKRIVRKSYKKSISIKSDTDSIK